MEEYQNLKTALQKLGEESNLSIQAYSWEDFFQTLNLSEKLEIIKKGFPAGFYHSQKECAIFFLPKLANVLKDTDAKNSVLFFGMYHESRHGMQKREDFDYLSMIMDMEAKIMAYDQNFYLKNYHRFYMEIDANLYGVKKLEDYMQKNPELFTKKDQEYVTFLKQRYAYDQNNYSFDQIFHKYDKVKRQSPYVREDPWDYLFYQKKKTRPFCETLCFPELTEISQEFVYRLLTSKVYHRKKDYTKESLESLRILRNFLWKRLQEEQTKIKFNEQAKKEKQAIREKSFEKDQACLFKNLEFCEQKIKEIEKVLTL